MSSSETITLPREVVERVLHALWNTAHGEPCFSKNVRDSMAALRAALVDQPDAIITTSVPTGWKLVPVEPTVEMMDAGGAATRRCYQHLNKDEVMCSYVYRHMLAAAPQPPALGRPQSNPAPYLWYDHNNGDTWTQEAIDEGFCATDSLIPLYTK